jgi:hypothetical protein
MIEIASMIARALRLGALTAGGLALAGTAGCNGAAPAPHGSPVLTDVFWISGDTTARVFPNVSQPDVASSAPPLVDEIDFVFDQRLDGAKIEETFTMGGVTMTRPNLADPPITVTWPQKGRPGEAAFTFSVRYNSLGRYGNGTSYVFLRPGTPGVPSSTKYVTFNLDAARLTNEYGERAVLPKMMSVPVATGELTVSVSAPTTAVGGTFQLPIVFSNRMPPPPLDARPSIQVYAGGAEVPFKLLADATLSSRWFIAPADCLGRWPASTTFTAVIASGLHDAFGGTLVPPVTPTSPPDAPPTLSATFTTGPGAAGTPDCGAVTDGGATDGAVAPDAAADLAPTDAPGDFAAPDVAADSTDGAVGADGGAGEAADGASIDAAAVDATAGPDATDATASS